MLTSSRLEAAATAIEAKGRMEVEALVPAQRLAAFLDEVGLPGRGEPVQVARIGAGKSNLTFSVRRGRSGWVLRRPPAGDIPDTAHDMLREHRVLAALADASVRTPRPVAVCEDAAVLGVPFYLMESIEGVVIRDRLPRHLTIEQRARLGEEMVDALAELHAVDAAAVGLDGLGSADGYLARQVRRWSRQWEVMATRALPDVEAVRDWLAANVPVTQAHAIVHGDYKLDNVLWAPAGAPRLLAILDWEMSTLGDPLADLGYLLLFWPEPGEEQLALLPQPTAQPGFATRAQLVARYCERTGLAPTQLDFYRTLALWKLAILSEGLYKRHLAGHTDSDWYAGLEDGVPTMARRARVWAKA